jgi:OmpA-OmpF porin, OOP family
MKATKIIIASLLLALVSTSALAARRGGSYDRYDSSMQPNTYIGLSGGQTSTDISNVSTTATAYSVFLGYSFNKFVAAELAYTKLGSLDLGSLLAGATLDMTASSLSLVGSLPMGQMASLYGKVGYASTASTVSTASATGTTQTQTGAVVGAGVQFNLGKNMNLRVSYDRYSISTDGTTTNVATVPSVGVMFRF